MTYIQRYMMTEEEEKKSIHLKLPKEKVKDIQIRAIKEDKSQSEVLEEAYDFFIKEKGKK